MSILPTPRQLQAEKNKQHLIDTAMELFFEYDINAVTINDICKRCSMTKGAFYHHFTSKDHIVTLTINTKLDEYVLAHFHGEEGCLKDRLTELLLCGFSFFQSLGKAMTRDAYEALVRSSINVRIDTRPFVKELMSLVDEGLQTHAFTMDMDPLSTYMMIIAIYSGMIIKWCNQPDELDAVLHWKLMISAQINMMLRS